MMKRFSFEPIIDENSKVLILGTMPGNKSLQFNQYYANPTNQFWKILSFITATDFITDYEIKKRLLLKHHIAIWDVLMHCEREGSLDINISDEASNDFQIFLPKYPSVKAVFFNGSKAERLFGTYNLFDANKAYITLPSTSSANTSMTLEKKAKIWKESIVKFL